MSHLSIPRPNFIRTVALLVCTFTLTACSTFQTPVARGAKPKDHGLIGAGEGPAWHDGSLYFTDGERINRMGPDGRTGVFRENASNGLLFDREGRLVACESGLRRVTWLGLQRESEEALRAVALRGIRRERSGALGAGASGLHARRTW